MLIALRLSRAGYGTPVEILQWPVTKAMDTLEYENFVQDYEQAVSEMNREED
jgi:hypothetical protein